MRLGFDYSAVLINIQLRIEHFLEGSVQLLFTDGSVAILVDRFDGL
jgi:hypothetical protein